MLKTSYFTSCAGSLLTVFLLASPLAAQPEPVVAVAVNDVAALRDELVQLRAEVGTLKAEVASLRRVVATIPAAPVPTFRPAVFAGDGGENRNGAWHQFTNSVNPGQVPQAVTPEALEVLKTQVEEQAQAKVESSSRLPVKLSGTVLANTVVNSAEVNWLENPNLATAPPPGSTVGGSMSATVRQSRIGLAIGRIPIGSWQATGTLIFDFFGGVPNFQTGTVMGLPRLIYGFGRLENDRTAIHVGQDHVLLAPRDPTSLAALSFPLFFRAGNLYLRAPQARLEQKIGGVTLAGGIVSPLAGDFSDFYEFAPAAGTGERSKRPALEGRLGFARGDQAASGELALGVSGHYGWRRRGDRLTEAWAVAIDANARAGRVGLAGEYYAAENAEPFGGGISQAGRASGGWVEGRVAINQRTDLNGGFGLDRPDNPVGRVLRSENRSAFGNVIFRFTPEVATSFEYRWLETEVGFITVKRKNHHVNAVFAVSF